MSDNIKIIAILGPTSSGKSDLAIRLARKFNGEIVAAELDYYGCFFNYSDESIPRKIT